MYRIVWDPEYHYIIQKRFLYFFWYTIRYDGALCISYSKREHAEEVLEKYIDKKNLQKSGINPDIKYYLNSNNKLLSGDTINEVNKKSKLKAFL